VFAIVALKALIIWVGILVLSIANGALRESVFIPSLGSPAALVLSGMLLSALIITVAYLSLPWMQIRRPMQCWLVGFFSLHENTLAALFVSLDCQGEGVGRKLMSKVKDLRSHVCLHVYKENVKTVAFYRCCGFQEVTEQEDPYTGHVELVMGYPACLPV
jgi:GNAT superfamily N-acetyltransferase